MAWDSSRPVPWRRLIREWLIYVAIMAAIFLIFFRDDNLVGADGRACWSAARCTSCSVRCSPSSATSARR